MFEQYNEVFLQRDRQWKSRNNMYAITSNQKMIGTIEETPTSSKNIGNHLLKLLSLSTVAGVELRVLDGKANVVGTIKKEKVFIKNFCLSPQPINY